MALEYKITGGNYSQQWEFYVATLCLFVVFALPGFIYHYDLKKLLKSQAWVLGIDGISPSTALRLIPHFLSKSNLWVSMQINLKTP